MSGIHITIARLTGGLKAIPVRFRRLMEHCQQGLLTISKRKAQSDVPMWWAEFLFLLFDLFLIPEIYETWMNLVKWHTRSLSNSEKRLAHSVFGQAIKLDLVRVDEKAYLGCRTHHVIYVSFYTINAWGTFRPDILIHELVHVWQYQKMGSVYIPRALKAQRTREKYDYGGVSALRKCLADGGTLHDFNLEQQAEIIADYFCIRENIPPNWGKATINDLPVYEFFLKEIREI